MTRPHWTYIVWMLVSLTAAGIGLTWAYRTYVASLPEPWATIVWGVWVAGFLLIAWLYDRAQKRSLQRHPGS